MYSVTIQAPRKTTLVVVLISALALVLLVGAWYLHAYPFVGGKASPAGSLVGNPILGAPGPWGQLSYTDILIDIPDEFVLLPSPQSPPVSWFFRGYDKSGVMNALRRAGLPERDCAAFERNAAWFSATGGIRVEPGDPVILGLSPAVRAKIYAILLEIPENAVDLDPVWFRPEMLEKQLAESKLSPSSIQLLKRLLYRNEGCPLWFFVDRDTALRQLPNDHERRLFIKAISRKATVMARLVLDANSDVEGMAGYWGVNGRRKDIVPLMKSLQLTSDGWNPSLVYFLSPFVRDRLYTYPFPSSDPSAPKQDCFWSAFNAFAPELNNRFNDMAYIRSTLDRDYYSIFAPSQLGDIVFLSTGDGASVIHAAVYIADDIVFTKNGFHYTQPWILMHMKDMVATYTARHPGTGPLKPLYFRKRM